MLRYGLSLSLSPLSLTAMKYQYRLGCYGPDAYVFSIPLHTTAAWLQRNLGRTFVINGEPLTFEQVQILRPKFPRGTEIGWFARLEYFVEGSPRPQT